MATALDRELAWRRQRGQSPVTVQAIAQALTALGYKLDRSMDCRGHSRYLTGERAGESYPCMTTGIQEADTGLGAFQATARRDANFRKLQALRYNGELFAVVRGYLLEI
jgi:hypothetical protein